MVRRTMTHSLLKHGFFSARQFGWIRNEIKIPGNGKFPMNGKKLSDAEKSVFH